MNSEQAIGIRQNYYKTLNRLKRVQAKTPLYYVLMDRLTVNKTMYDNIKKGK